MSTPKKKNLKKISFSDRFYSFCQRNYFFFIVLLFVFNCILFLLAYRQSRPVVTVLFHEITNTVHRVLVVTSLVSQVSSLSTNVSESVSETVSIPVKYLYFESYDTPCFQYFGRIYKPGDFCSLGIVQKVFPDVVFCSDGNFVNTLDPQSIELQKLPSQTRSIK